MDHNSARMLAAIEENDRQGEKKIAFIQAFIGLYFLGTNGFNMLVGKSDAVNMLAMVISGVILLAAYFRHYLTRSEVLNNPMLNLLTVVDGVLIFLVILSQPIVLQLPFVSIFKTPSVIFLALYAACRMLRFDPMPVLWAWITVVFGWMSLLYLAFSHTEHVASNYRDYLTTGDIMIGAQLEMTFGFGIMMLALAIAARNAREVLSASAHVEDLGDAHREVAEKANQLESLLYSSLDAIVITNSKGEIIKHNPALCKILEHEDGDLVGVETSRFMETAQELKLKKELRNLLKTDDLEAQGRMITSELLTANGKTVPVEISMSRFKMGDENCVVSIVRDIAERKRMENIETRSMQRFEKVVNNALDAIIIIDEHNCISMLNPAAEEIFGYSFEEAKGQDIGRLIIPNRLRAAHNRGIKNYLETGIGPVLNQRYEVPAVTADGSEIMIELAVKELDTDNGKSFIGYVRDVSAAKEVERQLVEARDAAESAHRAKTRFLAMMSHEIRTPLNGVLGLLSVLETSTKSEENLKLIRSASESGQGLTTILNDLLDLSRLETGKFAIEAHDFHLGSMIESIMSLVTQDALDKGLEINARVSQNLPSILYGDSGRIRQVLLNLVWNSIKYTDAGSINIEVSAGRNNTITFTVKDTGTGLPEGAEKGLFLDLGSAEAEDGQLMGSGLGLAVCKGLVDSMDGHIWMRGIQGIGTCFSFELPLVEGSETGIFEQSEELGKPTEKLQKQLDILVVEDNELNQMVIGHFLKMLDCPVTFANNGREAIDAVSQTDFDLVLMDISMPEVNGYEATRKIRELPDEKKANVPIVALTACASEEDCLKAKQSGMDGFLAKPVNSSELCKFLKKVEAAGYDRHQMNFPTLAVDISISSEKAAAKGCQAEITKVDGNKCSGAKQQHSSIPAGCAMAASAVDQKEHPAGCPVTGSRGKQSNGAAAKPVHDKSSPCTNGDDVGFDPQILEPLLQGMNNSEKSEILLHVDHDFKKYKKGLEEVLCTNDLDMLERMTHGLKGIAGMFGAADMARQAAELNEASRKVIGGSEEHLPTDFRDDIERLIDRSVQYIECISAIEQKYASHKSGGGTRGDGVNTQSAPENTWSASL